jgi:hypothetical protein
MFNILTAKEKHLKVALLFLQSRQWRVTLELRGIKPSSVMGWAPLLQKSEIQNALEPESFWALTGQGKCFRCWSDLDFRLEMLNQESLGKYSNSQISKILNIWIPSTWGKRYSTSYLLIVSERDGVIWEGPGQGHEYTQHTGEILKVKWEFNRQRREEWMLQSRETPWEQRGDTKNLNYCEDQQTIRWDGVRWQQVGSWPLQVPALPLCLMLSCNTILIVALIRCY